MCYNSYMNMNTNFEYLPQIPAVAEHAIALQALTLQDVSLGGFDNPTQLANPKNEVKIGVQLGKLVEYPDNYSGYRQKNGLIVAYMKTNEWFTGDEAPFGKNMLARLVLQTRHASMKPKAYGIFGLVVDRSLENGDQTEILYDLLSRSIGQAAVHAAKVVNVVLHDKDPALEVAQDLEFHPVGIKGEAWGAPGLLQQRYQRIVE